jgi:predicted dehydrogenase
LCEKPFATTVQEADVVLRVASDVQRQVAVNHEFREMPAHRAVLDAARSKGDGSLVFAQVWQQMDLPPWTEAGWRGRLKRRTLFEAGVHLLDLLVALYGEFPSAVQASISHAALEGEERDAIVVAILEFSRGRLGVLTQNRVCRGERQYFEVRADFERASWRASFGGRARFSAGLHRGTRPHIRLEYGLSGLAWREVGGRRTIAARNPRDPNMTATRVVLDRTLTAFRNGGEPPTSGATARRLLEIVDACYESAAVGRRVSIPGPMAQDITGTASG